MKIRKTRCFAFLLANMVFGYVLGASASVVIESQIVNVKSDAIGSLAKALAARDRSFNFHSWKFDYQWYANMETWYTSMLKSHLLTYDDVLEIKRYMCKMGLYGRVSGDGEVYFAKRRIEKKEVDDLVSFVEKLLAKNE